MSAFGDFIAKYELLSGLGGGAILATVGFTIHRLWSRRPPALPSAVPRPDPQAAIVAQRKVAAYDRLIDLTHTAAGAIVRLYGLRQEPGFDDYSLADLDAYMTTNGFPGLTKASVLASWNTDRRAAKEELRATARQGEITRAERAYHEARNFCIGNSHYFSDRIQTKAHQVFDPLWDIIVHARIPDPGHGREITEKTKEAGERVEELVLLLRQDLGVANPVAGDRLPPPA